MEFCIYLDDFISNIPNFYCDDCPRCPDSGDNFDCPYHCFKKVKVTEEE